MKDRRVMSYFGKVIWTDGNYFMVAKGDGTDEIFETIEDAMRWIEQKNQNTELRRNER